MCEEENENLYAEVMCPYCDALVGCFFRTKLQLEVCFGCDQPLIIKWRPIEVSEIMMVVGCEVEENK